MVSVLTSPPRLSYAFGRSLVSILLTAILLFLTTPALAKNLPPNIAKLLGKKDSLLVTRPDGTVVWAHNPDSHRIPASTLKIFTSLLALETLTPDFRFKTEIYARGEDTLVLKGYGDPLFMSEVMDAYAEKLAKAGTQAKKLILDTSYFAPVSIPGTGSSANPYDAPVGAVSANFNTISFEYAKDGRPVSDEPQTPMIPFGEALIRKKHPAPGRVLLTHTHDQATLYAGHLFSWFVKKHRGFGFDSVALGAVGQGDRPLLTLESPFTLREVAGKCLEFSNNFIANQMFLAVGAHQYGPPANLEKSRRAAKEFAENALMLTGFAPAEGSGLSRNTRITARQMDRVLSAFTPFCGILKEENGVLYKTGTLNGVSARAGYILKPGKTPADPDPVAYRFVVFMNTPGRGAGKVTARVARSLRGTGAAQGR